MVAHTHSNALLTHSNYCSHTASYIHLLWLVDDNLDDGLAVLVLTRLGELEGLERILKLVPVGNERFEVDETTLDEGDGEGVVALAVPE